MSILNEPPIPQASQEAEIVGTHLPPPVPPRIPQYRRDILPANIVLSAEDLEEFSRIVSVANDRARRIEIAASNATVDQEQTVQQINDLMRVEYNYRAKNGDSVQGTGLPNTDDPSFPEELLSFFVSNASFPERAVRQRPLNTVEAFLDFEKPSLTLDLQTFPSNPTQNRSVINIVGRDEDWVISTADRVSEFLRRKKTFRPAIHGPGTYDYLVYLAFLPAVFWILYRYQGTYFIAWLSAQSMFLNVILGIYAILLPLLFARFLFQYVRWLFPPIEYYKRSRVGAYVHRLVAGSILSALLLSAAYEIVKAMILAMLS